MQKIFLILSFFFGIGSYAQTSIVKKTTDSLQTRVVLIGDAGSLIKGSPSVLNSVKRQFPFDEKTVVVFLGDNLYTYGLPDENSINYYNIKSALDSQIHLINGTKARAIMIPGNHDWANGAIQGFENVVRQQQYVDNAGNERMSYFPKNGCPGPVEIKLSKDVLLIAMDSQWWLHIHDKPGIESDCESKTEEEVIDQLKDIINKNYDKLIILATHHPFKSNGPHGGYYTWKQHIFPFTDLNKKLYIPLPFIGSIYPITRSVFGSHQDISHPKYANMINKIMSAVKTHPNVIMVAGHEHNLQYIKDSNYNYIVSGSGCKENRVSPSKKAEFGKQALGFATLEVYKNKSVDLSFFTLDNTKHDSLSQDYSKKILDFSKLPKIEVKDTVTATYIYKNYVTAPASNQYKKEKWFKRFINGSNYRAEWSEPITLKVFNINKEKGGFKIQGIGGGHQSTSLKLIDKKGKEWVLRTVDKDPEKAIPDNLRNSFVSSIVSDMISASHPYAAITTTSIAAAAGIIEPTREYFFVPEDKSLGYYLPLFANKVCMLEAKDANDEDDNKSTFKLMNKMRENNNTTIDQASVLNARLLDMLLGDWDRHFDQWRWGINDTGKGKTYYAMPKDRDQAFFNSEGWLVKLIGGKLPFVKGFKYNLNTLSQLNVAAKDFDRIFLNSITKQVWDSITVSFLNNVTDDVIRNSIKKLPPEIYKIRGEEIAAKLINRKTQLQKKSLAYYNFISKEVTVTGSNQNELFKVTKNKNGNITLTGYALDKKDGDSNFIIYQREFVAKETKEIRVFGFNGNDRFVIDSNVSTKIKVRFIGGKGNDTFAINGSSHTEIYDITTEQNYESGKGKHRTHFSSDPSINAYQIRSFQYPRKSIPALNVSYNAGDGIVAGLGFVFRNYKFRRQPFANEHKFVSLFAFTHQDFQLKYNGTFNQLIGKYDLLVNTKLNNPGFTNFFGLGNETKIIESTKFYRARYKTADLQILFRNSKSELLNYYAGPTILHYWSRIKDNKETVLSKPINVGLDTNDVYGKKTYAGTKIGLDINNIGNEQFPLRGIKWTNYLSVEKGIIDADNIVSKFESNMEVYATTKIPSRITGVIKLGGGKIFSDSTKYFQALYLGQDNNLRGFRRNRYGGDAYLYGSLEFRIRIFNGSSFLFPGQVGIIAFNDIGRVWKNEENSSKWHYVYGGGLYYVPFYSTIISATMGKGEDGTIFNISLGTKFNVNF